MNENKSCNTAQFLPIQTYPTRFDSNLFGFINLLLPFLIRRVVIITKSAKATKIVKLWKPETTKPVNVLRNKLEFRKLL